MPNCTRNGFDGVIQRSLHSAFEDRVCLIATVRLAKPQFIKVRIISCSFTSPFMWLTHIRFHASGFEKGSLIRTGLNSNGCSVTPGKPIRAPVNHYVQSPFCFCLQPLFFCLKTLYIFVSFFVSFLCAKELLLILLSMLEIE